MGLYRGTSTKEPSLRQSGVGLSEVMEEEKKYPILVEAVLSKEHLPEVLANLVSCLYKYAYVS